MADEPKGMADLMGGIRVPPARVLSTDDRQERANRLEADLGDAGFPLLHLRTARAGKLSDSDAWGLKKCALMRRLSAGPTMVALIGPRGTGKTQMAVVAACLYAEAQAERGRTKVARYTRLMEFFMAIKDSYGAQTSERDAIAPYARPRLLVLDEVQVRNNTDWERNALTYMVDIRYSDCKSTILISNETPDAFVASVGDSIASRITEMGSIMSCDWKSYRT